MSPGGLPTKRLRMRRYALLTMKPRWRIDSNVIVEVGVERSIRSYILEVVVAMVLVHSVMWKTPAGENTEWVAEMGSAQGLSELAALGRPIEPEKLPLLHGVLSRTVAAAW